MPPLPPDDGLDALDRMADRATRRHRRVPPPKRPGLPSSGSDAPSVPPTTSDAPAEQPPPAPEPATHQERPAAGTGDAVSTRTPRRAGTRARRPTGTAGRRDGRIAWTTDAKAVRLALTTYQAQVRKVRERAREARQLARRVPAEDLAVIVARVAEDTGADAGMLAQVVGLESPAGG